MRWRRKRDRETDLERELRSHLEQEAEEWRQAGLSSTDARYAAQRALGNTAFIKEEVRLAWGRRKLEQLAQDIRYALRGMYRSPGFTTTALLSLALGIGANTAIFTVVNAVLLKPLPFPEPGRIVQLWETKPAKGTTRNVINPFNFLDWQERTRSFEAMAAVQPTTTNLTGGGDPQAVEGMEVGQPYFSILAWRPHSAATSCLRRGSQAVIASRS